MWFDRLIDGVDTLARVYMRIGGLARPVRLGRTYFDAQVLCDIRDFIQRRIYYFGIYEPNLSHYLAQRIEPGDHVVDVGANIGYVSLLAAHLVGPGTVIAVEASPSTYLKLCANLRRNGIDNVVPVNAAATGESCLIEIVEGSDRNIGSGSVRPAGERAARTVRGVPLSTLIVEPEKVTLIKIDIEGSEGAVLADILAHLDRFPRLRTIAVEMVPSSGGYLDRFRAAGFQAYALPNNYRIGATLVRAYLDRSREGDFVVKRPVEAYAEAFTDYVFERDVSVAEPAQPMQREPRIRIVSPSLPPPAA